MRARHMSLRRHISHCCHFHADAYYAADLPPMFSCCASALLRADMLRHTRMAMFSLMLPARQSSAVKGRQQQRRRRLIT